MSGAAVERRQRLLFLLPFAPRLDARHGGRAIAHLIVELAQGHDVAVLHLRADDEEPADEAVVERCTAVDEIVLRRRRTGFMAAPWLARLILQAVFGRPMQATELWSRAYAERARQIARAWHPDVVQAEMHAMAQYLPALREFRAGRILRVHELAPTHEFFATASGLEAILRRLDVHAWQRFERRVFADVDAVVAFTAEDAAAIRRTALSALVAAIPLHVPVPPRPLDPLGSSPATVVFVGGLRHPPNLDAAIRLATKIFPRVREDVPTAILEIVGPDAPERLRALGGQGVIIVGAVPDVTPFLDRAAVFAAPLRIGGGMRVKIIEALAAGKAVVASRLAARGLEVVDGRHLLLAETDRDFSDAILRLLAEPRLRATLAASAREWALARFQQRRTVSAYETLFAQVLSRRQSRPVLR